MDDFLITSSSLPKHLTIPPSKSHTLRAILFASLAKGTSRIEQYLQSPDTNAMIEAVRLLGAEVTIELETLHIRGVAGKPQIAKDVIQCGNSGLVLRLVGAIAGLIPGYTIFTGDASIRENRHVQPLLDGLRGFGAFAASSRDNGRPPILIKGPLTNNFATLDGSDSQPVSGLLIAGAFAPHPTELHVTNPGEKPWIDLTLSWLKKFNIPYSAKNYTHYRMEGGSHIDGFTYMVPGDFSTAAFPIAAALLTDSEIILHNLDMNDVQGDKRLIPILQQMGAKIIVNDTEKTLHVKKGSSLQGMRIDVNDCIDALPILAVLGCFAKGKTELVNGAIARKKESDRIALIALELRKMGAEIEEREDGLLIETSQLHGAEVHSHADHRLALSLSVAAMGAVGPSKICNVSCIDKTYPNFSKNFGIQ